MDASDRTWENLTDSFGRRHDYLRLSLTDRCNFRCQYCMPEEGIEWTKRAQILTFEEIVRLVGVFAQLGVSKVRLTGGEPTVRKGLVELVASLAKIPGIQKLLMTTNGFSSERLVPELKKAGLNGLNFSMDSLKRERFEEITRRDGLIQVLWGIEAAIAAGMETKINVVVLPGLNDEELVDFVEFARTRPVQVRFIEFMPFAGNLWNPDRVFGYADMLSVLSKRFDLKVVPGQPSDVAKEFAIEGFLGTIGFISSMTDDFCGGCNRIRLTADGKIKTCLFLPTQTSLRDMMRSGCADDDLAKAIRGDLKTKWAGHPPMGKWQMLDKLSMVQIGG